MGGNNVDFGSIALPKTRPEEAHEKGLPIEVVVKVAADGSFKLNDRVLPKRELVEALKKLKAEAKVAKQEIRVSLVADSRSNYERVTEVLDAAKQAGVTDVSFQAGEPEHEAK